MNVIINADDFGYGENKTLAIVEAMAKGLITTTTIMANMPWFNQAIKMAKVNHFIDQVGLHFNMTEGRALTPEMRACRLFCDENGCFTARFHHRLKTRLFLPRSAQATIAIEAEAQIKRYIEAGCTLMHLDSHHHVHTDFSVAFPLLRVARKFGFKSVRLSRTVGKHITFSKRFYKVLFNSFQRQQLPARVDEFTEYEGFVTYVGTLNPNARVEIMMHPQYVGETGIPDLNGQLCDANRNMAQDEMFWKQAEENGIFRVGY